MSSETKTMKLLAALDQLAATNGVAEALAGLVGASLGAPVHSQRMNVYKCAANVEPWSTLEIRYPDQGSVRAFCVLRAQSPLGAGWPNEDEFLRDLGTRLREMRINPHIPPSGTTEVGLHSDTSEIGVSFWRHSGAIRSASLSFT